LIETATQLVSKEQKDNPPRRTQEKKIVAIPLDKLT